MDKTYTIPPLEWKHARGGIWFASSYTGPVFVKKTQNLKDQVALPGESYQYVNGSGFDFAQKDHEKSVLKSNSKWLKPVEQ